jgi:dTDP-4-amino-4,6-dideoxygalactose transaminase
MVASSDRKIIDTVIASREYDNRETYAPGFNFKLSDIHAGLARTQLGKLPAMIKKRRLLAGHYRNLLNGLCPSLGLPPADESVMPVYFRFVVRCRSASLRDTIIRKMDVAGVACRKPVFLPLHRYLGQSDFTGTDALYERALSLPIYPGMEKEDVEYIARQLEKIIGIGKVRRGS